VKTMPDESKPKRKHYESQNRANMKHRAKAYDRIEILVPQGMREVYNARAAERGLSLPAHIRDLLNTDLEAQKKSGGDIPTGESN